MQYTIQETVNTVGWSEAGDTAPADLVKVAKEMAERGEVATFGKITHQTTPPTFTWCIISLNAAGNMIVAKRHLEVTNS